MGIGRSPARDWDCPLILSINLLEHDADVKARNNNGEIAYELAERVKEEILKLLTKHVTVAA